jgi:hypothetical protein
MIGDAEPKRSRFERSQNPRPISLQPRDEAIMAFVSEFGLLSREQLQRLLDFPCVTRINIRLKKLYDHGYLSRRFFPAVIGSPRAFYFLGLKGVGVVSESMGIDPLVLKRGRESVMEQKDLFLNHQLFLNDVRIALTLAIKNHPQMILEQWLKEKDCLVEFPSNRGMKALRPDGYFCLSCQGKSYSFFLEADCSTMTNGRMKSKARAYLDYARSGLFERQFGFRYFRVLVITKTIERLLNLKSTIEELTDRIFYLTTKDQLCQSQISDRIWHRAGREGLFSLMEG